MRTTLNLDEKILEDLMRFTEAKTKTEAVNRAVADWVRLKRIEILRSRRGKIGWDGDLNEMRALEIQESQKTHG